MTDAAAVGHQIMVLTASNQGYPLYRKFGFEHIFDYQEVWEQ
jgi:predicted acetyltransferase